MILGSIGGKIFKGNINFGKYRRNCDVQKRNWYDEIYFMFFSKMIYFLCIDKWVYQVFFKI